MTNEGSQPTNVGSNDELGLEVEAYSAGRGVRIEACRQRDGSRLWAVRNSFGDVLNKQGEWEWEPHPSGRSEAFLSRCRFDTPLAARDAYMADVKA